MMSYKEAMQLAELHMGCAKDSHGPAGVEANVRIAEGYIKFAREIRTASAGKSAAEWDRMTSERV